MGSWRRGCCSHSPLLPSPYLPSPPCLISSRPAATTWRGRLERSIGSLLQAAISASHRQFLPLTRLLLPHPVCTTLSTLIYTTPHYAPATETNSKLGRDQGATSPPCTSLHAHLGSGFPAGVPCPQHPADLGVVQPAVRCVGPASLPPWPICFSGLPLRDSCTVLRPPTSFLCPATPRPRRGRPVCAATGHPREHQQPPPQHPEQHGGRLKSMRAHDDLHSRLAPAQSHSLHRHHPHDHPLFGCVVQQLAASQPHLSEPS